MKICGLRVAYYQLSRETRRAIREGYLMEFNLVDIRTFYRDIDKASDIPAKRLLWFSDKLHKPPKELI